MISFDFGRDARERRVCLCINDAGREGTGSYVYADGVSHHTTTVCMILKSIECIFGGK